MNAMRNAPTGQGRGAGQSNEAGSFAINHNPTELLLSRLEGVRKYGRGWRSKCPSCGGRSHKVSIAEADNGAVLLHAFCGCAPADVLGAVGLTLADLFPKPLRPLTDAERRQARQRAREAGWGAALDTLVTEGTIVLFAARELHMTGGIEIADGKRLALAMDRLCEAQGVLRGR